MTDTNSFPSFFFANAKPGAPLSYEALVARRKIAESLMGKRSPFPKGLGEGLTYAGERIGDVIRMRDLDEQERALDAGRQQFQMNAALPGVVAPPGGAPAPEMPLPGVPVPGAPAPVAAAPAAAEPSPIPSHLIGAKPVQTTREAPLAPPPAPALPDLPPSPGPRQQFGEAVPQAPTGSPDLPVRDSIAAAMVPLPRLQPTDALPAPGAPEVPSEVPLPLPRPEEAPLPPRNALPDASSPAPELGVLQRQSGVRRMPLAAPLERQLQTAAAQAGLGVEVNSGGQPSSGPNRIGSHRHDAGAAADLRLFERTEDGGKRYLSQNNPADRARMADFVRASVAAGATGVGSGPGYMGESGIHIGGGTPAVWGAGGRSANAPEWLRAAYQGGATGTPDAARANAGPTGGPTPADNPPIVTAQIKQMPGSVAPFAPPGSNFFQPDSMVGGSTGGASPTQIRPAPQVPSPAPAPSPYLNPPLDPLDPRPPQAPVPSVGRVVTPPTQFRGEPVPPNENDVPLNQHQIRGQQLLMMAGTDPFKQQAAQRLIEFGNQQRASEISQRKQVYEARKDIYKGQEEKLLTHNLGAAEREVSLKKQEIENAKALQDAADRAARGGLTPGEAHSIVRESHKNVAHIPDEVAAIRNAQKVLPQMVTGFGAEAKVNVLRVLSALGQPIDPSVSATQQFQSYVKGVYGRLRPQVIGAGPQSNTEGKVLENAAAGNISLTPEAINAVLNSIYSLNVMAAKQHQKTLITFTNVDPSSQQYNINTFGLPMENIVPDAAVRILQDHYKEKPQEAIIEFNRDFSTPGLAQKILGLR